jgi:hypothetical protein
VWVSAGNVTMHCGYICYLVCVYVSFVDARTKSDYFSHNTLRDWFMYPRRCVYCVVRTEFLNANRANFRLCGIFKGT